MRKPSIVSSGPAVSQGLCSVSSAEARLSPITSPQAFEALFEASPELMCVRDLRGKLIRLNTSWSTTLGFAMSDLNGAPLLDLVHPQDVWATHDVMHGVTDERMVLGFSNRYRTLGGGYRRLEWTARRFGDHVFGLGREVVEL